MGLDFTLYRKRKDMSISKFYKRPWEDIEKDELAYGRKSWELVNMLATNNDVDEGYGILQKEAWDNLMKHMAPIGDQLEDIIKAYEHFEYTIPGFVSAEDTSDFEYWYRTTFECEPRLGYSFAANYLKNFWDARNKIEAVLNDSENEVLMIISY